MLSKYLLLELALAAAPALAGTPVTCAVSSLPLSCENTTTVDTCCVNYPGGDLLQTQFWDTDPSTGPADSWTVHGLWPDNCDGTYEQYCDASREVTNITDILAESAPCILQYMNKYWKDYEGDDETFWEHEFNKHGTCISSLEPACYVDYEAHDEVTDYFTRTVQLFRSLPSYEWLAAAGIVPSTTATYTLAQIQSALSAQFGHNVIINCDGSTLNELWYHYHVRGNVQSGEFVPVEPVGSGSTCPSTGIKYLPKYSNATTTTTTTATTATSTAPPSGTSGVAGALSGKGYIYVTTPSTTSGGFIISGGTWYSNSGTPATFTATANADNTTFTLTSSKGKCAVLSDSSLSCSSTVSTASSFGYDGTYLTYNNQTTFYSDAVPTGSVQKTVYTTVEDVSLQLTWTSR